MNRNKPLALAVFSVSATVLASSVSFASSMSDAFISPKSNIAVVGRAHTNVLIARKPTTGVQPFAIPGTETPSSLRSVYHISSSLNGHNAIAIVDAYDDPKALNDFNAYASAGGFPKETSTSVTASTNKVFQVVYASGSKPGTDPGGPLGWDLEESLDIEIAHGIAPNAKIYLVEAASNSDADLYAGIAVAKGLPNVHEVSLSWGGGEYNGETSNDSLFTSSNKITFFASTGDNGAAPGVSYPAISPNVIGVGGTTINLVGGTFLSESAWSGSGGGFSVYEKKPAFQNGIAGIGTYRGIPDISADADPNSGVGVYDTNKAGGAWYQVGGTSLACPLIAALVDDSNVDRSSSVSENTTIYKNLGSNNLRDITTGSNGYSAGPGWDPATGVGVPNTTGAL